MVEASNPTQDMIDITGHVVHDGVSYDKDVLEIKLPDTVVTSGYGGNFVKDVCIDEGVFPHRRILEEKKLDEKSPPKFDFLMIDSNSDLRYEGKGDAKKYVHELKPETVLLPVGAADDNTEKQCDLEGKSTVSMDGDISEKKISLQELLKLESAEESQERLKLQSAEGSQTQHQSTTISTISENHTPAVHGEAIEHVSTNDCQDVATASKTDELTISDISSNDNPNGSPVTISDRGDAIAALDKPISTVDVTDSLSGSKEFNEVGTAEVRPDALTSSSSSEVQPSENSNDHCENFTSEAITTDALDENAVASSSSPLVVQSSDANRENNKNSDNDGATDVHDFSQTDKQNCADTTTISTTSKSSTNEQKDSTHADELDVPDNNEKGKSLIGNGYPLEPCSLGPSIMCNPVSTSGHIGNVSIRSDSSTTSTRSFAFPVLQWDWSSSPVRMAKAERRRIMRHRGWKKGKSFLCWKF